MRRSTPWPVTLLLLALAGGCQSGSPPPDHAQLWTAGQLFYHDATGIGFEVPATWQLNLEDGVLILAGSGQQPSYFTTLTVQAARMADHDPEGALANMAETLAGMPGVAWGAQEAVVLPHRFGLRYHVEFEFHESLRLRHGVVFNVPDYAVDLAYSAVPELFGASVSCFERALDTLTVAEP